MLFISRRVVRDHGTHITECFGVVDTDDNVENVVASDELCKAFFGLGLDIKGISIDQYDEWEFMPYQHPDYLTPYQVKLQALRGIKVITWNSMIVDMSFNGNQPGERIRLSDFGTSVADWSLFYAGDHKNPVTLVFDDKLKSITSWSFRIDCGMHGDTSKAGHEVIPDWMVNTVRYDLRELTNIAIAESLYRQVAVHDKSFSVIIDSDSRKRAMLQRFGDS